MVKVGFIVEGITEKIILEKSDFFNHLRSLGINFIKDVLNAEGIGNLLPHRIVEYTEILTKRGATKILILADLDADTCITITRDRIKPLTEQILVISVKEIESWFLSDTGAISKFLSDSTYNCSTPEEIINPFEEIRSIRLAKMGVGIGTKPKLANQMLRNNFSILKAAEHPNCNSAKYFLKKIKELSTL